MQRTDVAFRNGLRGERQRERRLRCHLKLYLLVVHDATTTGNILLGLAADFYSSTPRVNSDMSTPAKVDMSTPCCSASSLIWATQAAPFCIGIRLAKVVEVEAVLPHLAFVVTLQGIQSHEGSLAGFTDVLLLSSMQQLVALQIMPTCKACGFRRQPSQGLLWRYFLPFPHVAQPNGFEPS